MTSGWNNKPSRILIHAPNWVGDHAMAFSFYLSAKKIFPESEIDLMGRTWVWDLLPRGVFRKVIPLHGKKIDRQLIINLKKEKYDLGFTLSPSFRSAYFLFRAGIPVRLGYPGDMRGTLLRHPRFAGSLRIPPYNKYEHRSLSYLRLLTPFFPPDKTAEDYFSGYLSQIMKTDLELSPEKKKEMELILKKENIKKKNFWIICPGSVAPSKVYPVDYLVRIIHGYLEKNKTAQIVFSGSSLEKEYVRQILSSLDKKFRTRVRDLTELTSLSQSVYLMENARGIIANDSGIAHIAAFTGTPLVTFLGMGRKEETLTLSRQKTVFNLNLPCSPCMKKTCPRKNESIACLRGIHPEWVLDSMLEWDASTGK